jgi:hypothetical protein
MTEPHDGEWRDADAYVILHRPADGTPAYCIGPFPPLLDIVEAVAQRTVCDCQREVLPCAFPRGVRMALVADPAMVAAALDRAQPKDEPVH